MSDDKIIKAKPVRRYYTVGVGGREVNTPSEDALVTEQGVLVLITKRNEDGLTEEDAVFRIWDYYIVGDAVR